MHMTTNGARGREAQRRPDSRRAPSQPFRGHRGGERERLEVYLLKLKLGSPTCSVSAACHRRYRASKRPSGKYGAVAVIVYRSDRHRQWTPSPPSRRVAEAEMVQLVRTCRSWRPSGFRMMYPGGHGRGWELPGSGRSRRPRWRWRRIRREWTSDGYAGGAGGAGSGGARRRSGCDGRTLLRELVSRVPSPAMAVAAVAASIYFTAAQVRRAAAEYSREVPEVKVVPETAAEAAAEAERAEPTMCCREAPPTMSDSAVRGLPARAAPVDRVQPGSVVQAVPVGFGALLAAGGTVRTWE